MRGRNGSQRWNYRGRRLVVLFAKKRRVVEFETFSKRKRTKRGRRFRLNLRRLGRAYLGACEPGCPLKRAK
jgi:hypothetical protein